MLWIAGLTIVLLAWWYHGLLLLATWENRRFARMRIQSVVPGVVPWQRVALLVPCKGAEPGLAENLRCFLRQDHPNYEVMFVVESRDDSAHPITQRLLADETEVACQLLVAGRAWDTGQKAHNLRHAIGHLSDAVNTGYRAGDDQKVAPARPARTCTGCRTGSPHAAHRV